MSTDYTSAVSLLRDAALRAEPIPLDCPCLSGATVLRRARVCCLACGAEWESLRSLVRAKEGA